MELLVIMALAQQAGCKPVAPGQSRFLLWHFHAYEQFESHLRLPRGVAYTHGYSHIHADTNAHSNTLHACGSEAHKAQPISLSAALPRTGAA